MKTQLLQDIGDSGAAPAGPDGRGRPRHGAPHQAQPQPPPEPPPGKPPGAAQTVRPSVWHRAPAAPDATELLPGTEGETAPAAGPAHDFATAPEPDWLAELMRQDAERADARRKAGRWRRRAFGWSIGAGVLALLAAGALWMIEARRVDGTMDVLAEAGAPAARTPAAGAPAALPSPAPAPLAAPAPALAPVLSSPRPAPTILEEVVKPAGPVSTEPVMPGIRREHATPKAATRAPVEHTQADRRKREETLLQCRALGYGEQQCIRRECEMTRFGLACRGGVMGEDVPP